MRMLLIETVPYGAVFIFSTASWFFGHRRLCHSLRGSEHRLSVLQLPEISFVFVNM